MESVTKLVAALLPFSESGGAFRTYDHPITYEPDLFKLPAIVSPLYTLEIILRE